MAEGIKNDPFLAAILLIFVVVAFVLTLVKVKPGGKILWGFIALAGAAMGAVTFICVIEIRKQQEQINKIPILTVGDNPDTFHLADKLTADQKQDILEVLRRAVSDVSESLKCSKELIRANVFGVDEQGKLRMIKELTVNMNRPIELTIQMPIGYGSTGKSFQSGEPNIAVFHANWGVNLLSDDELRKAHPDLQWIISVPVRGKGAGTGPIWVMNIDGLKGRRDETDLRHAMKRLLDWSYTISLIISTTHDQIVVGSKSQTESANTSVARMYPITDITAADFAPASGRFENATLDLKTVTPLNRFTKDEFKEQVKAAFTTKDEKLKPQ